MVACNGKDLQFKEDVSPQTLDALLSRLATTAATSPGLEALTIHPPISTTPTAALASLALLHHVSTLASLSLPALSQPTTPDAPSATLISSLRQLTLLSHLAISFPDPFPRYGTGAAEAVHHLAAVVSSLPHLASFRLFNLRTATYMQLPQRGANNKRHAPSRGSGVTTAHEKPSLDSIVAALAAAPALTHLILGAATPNNSVPLPLSTLRGRFPALRDLEILYYRPAADPVPNPGGADPAAASRLVPTPPLPHLTAFSFRSSRESKTRHEFDAIAACAAQHPRLRCLELQLWNLPEGASASLASALRSMPQLERVDLGLGPGQDHSVHSMRRVTKALAHHTGMTRLSLSVECMHAEWNEDTHRAEAHGEDGGMLSPLRALTALQSLSLTDQQQRVGFVQAQGAKMVAAVVPELTRLTSLVTGFGVVPVRLHVVAPSWARLPQLQRLCFHSVLLEDLAAFEAGLAALTTLTELRVAVMPVSGALVGRFAAAARALPRLRQAQLLSCMVSVTVPDASQEAQHGERDWIDGLVHLPPRGRFAFAITNDGITDAEYAAVRQALVARGATVSPQCGEVSFLQPGEKLEWGST